jgi:hypothetical protein
LTHLRRAQAPYCPYLYFHRWSIDFIRGDRAPSRAPLIFTVTIFRLEIWRVRGGTPGWDSLEEAAALLTSRNAAAARSQLLASRLHFSLARSGKAKCSAAGTKSRALAWISRERRSPKSYNLSRAAIENVERQIARSDGPKQGLNSELFRPILISASRRFCRER